MKEKRRTDRVRLDEIKMRVKVVPSSWSRTFITMINPFAHRIRSTFSLSLPKHAATQPGTYSNDGKLGRTCIFKDD